MATIGVDLGGTKILAAVIHDGKAHNAAKAPTPTDGPDSVVEAIAALIEQTAADSDADVDKVGIGAPGHIDHKNNVLLEAPNLVGFDKTVPLAQLVADKVGGKPEVRLDNDVVVAALGEAAHGAGKGTDDFLAVWVGTGVGGAVVLGGKVRRGVTGGAGEIGHTTIWPQGRACKCGGVGHLEAYAGRAALEVEARRRDAAGEKSKLVELAGADRMKSKIFADALAAHDSVAESLIDDAVQALGIAIASYVTVIDVGLVVIGGGLGGRLGTPFADRIRDVAEQKVFNGRKITVAASELVDDAGVVGAAELF